MLILLYKPHPHLKYVATCIIVRNLINVTIIYTVYTVQLGQPTNFSLIACFLTSMFRKAVWQHVQGVVGVLITILRQIYKRIFR